MTQTLLMRLEREGVAATVRLKEDGARREPALAHGLGLALSYTGELPAPIRPLVVELGRRFAALGDGPASVTQGMRALSNLLADLDPRAHLRSFRRLLAGQVAPRWSPYLRAGDHPQPGAIWPFDPEAVALELGLRDVLKREHLPPLLLAAERDRFQRRGWATAMAGASLFVGRERSAVEEAADTERALHAGGPAGDEAARRQGALLGYPPCCVAAYLRCRKYDDLTLYAHLLPPLPPSPAPALSVWLPGPLALVSHAPCAVDCAATLALAASIARGLESRRPGFLAAWTPLAARLHIIDVAGRALALDVEGEGPWQVRSAVVLQAPSSPDLSGLLQPLPALEDARLCMEEGALVGPGIHATLAADHRGTLIGRSRHDLATGADQGRRSIFATE